MNDSTAKCDICGRVHADVCQQAPIGSRVFGNSSRKLRPIIDTKTAQAEARAFRGVES